ncbi:MAG: hypothetical protein U0401_18845 [Anaerolineae bacterium]
MPPTARLSNPDLGDDLAYLSRAGSYAIQGQPEAALADFETVLRLDPREARAWPGED